MKKPTVLVALALVSLIVVTFSLTSATTFASGTGDAICEGIKQANNNGCTGGGATLTNAVANIINIFSLVIGIVAVIMIMVGGFKYVTAGSDSGKLGGAKSTITYAVIGLVIVAMSQFIVQFVIRETSNDPKAKQSQTNKTN